jgi:ribosomal protein L23
VIKPKILKTESLRTMLALIKYPLITDKTTRLLQSNKYSFMVDKRANKFTVKKVI